MGPAEALPLQLRLVRRNHVFALHRGDPQRELADGEAVRGSGLELADAAVRVADAERQGHLHHHRQVSDGGSQGIYLKECL